MKRSIFSLVILFALGCSAKTEYRAIDSKSYEINQENRMNIGSPFIHRERGMDIKWIYWSDIFRWHNETAWYHCQGFLKEELIYSGRSGDTIRVLYREYENNVAPQYLGRGQVQTDQVYFMRPAFSQTLQYDLFESTTIVFREFAIEVIEADNRNILYRVLQDGE